MEAKALELLKKPEIKKRVDELVKSGVRLHNAIAQADQEKALNK